MVQEGASAFVNPREMTQNAASGRCDVRTPADSDRHVLECPGAALVSKWKGLSTEVQRGIFKHAAATKAYDPVALSAAIARFLHDHKNDAGAGNQA